MSVIGPRPTLRYQVDAYDERQRHRLDVKPGITGWAQIHGRASLPWAERIELDLWYVAAPRLEDRPADPAAHAPRPRRRHLQGRDRRLAAARRVSLFGHALAGPCPVAKRGLRKCHERSTTYPNCLLRRVAWCDPMSPNDGVPALPRTRPQGLTAPSRPLAVPSAAVTAVLFTCAGQRVDIVSAFRAAGATTIAADVEPLAPALYLADRPSSSRAWTTPGYVAGAARARRASRRAADRPAHRSRPAAARARTRPARRALVLLPEPETIERCARQVPRARPASRSAGSPRRPRGCRRSFRPTCASPCS